MTYQDKSKYSSVHLESRSNSAMASPPVVTSGFTAFRLSNVPIIHHNNRLI